MTQQIVMRKNRYKIFLGHFAHLLVYTKISLGSDLKTNGLSYLGNFSSSVLYISHNSFPFQKSWWKVQVNVVTPQELKIVCRESNKKKW